jgi:exodeoxyribonuclease I
MAPSFYWYDLETSGTDNRWDRIVQFAGIRTDAQLNEVGDELSTYVRLPLDVLPDPAACLVTGLSPQRVNAEGMDELSALDAIEQRFMAPGTCVAGFNNLRFDDEFVRHAFFRQLRDPYAREWRNGNSRWDLIDLVRATAALRPEGIEWPSQDGLPVFRLEVIAAANGIHHGRAHDALSDVRATVGLARLIRDHQPRLFEYYLGLRNRVAVLTLLSPDRPEIRVHVSGMLPRSRRCVAPVMPLALHPHNRNTVIAVDLNSNIEPLLALSARRLADLIFTPAGAGADPEARPRIKEIRANRCPFVAPLASLRRQDRARLDWDMNVIDSRFRTLARARGLKDKLRAVYGERPQQSADDVDESLYQGFVGDADRTLCTRVLGELRAGRRPVEPEFRDPRLSELLFRLRARCFEHDLSAGELERWRAFVRGKLLATEARWRTLPSFRAALANARAMPQTPAGQALLADLEAHAEQVGSWLQSSREPVATAPDVVRDGQE